MKRTFRKRKESGQAMKEEMAEKQVGLIKYIEQSQHILTDCIHSKPCITVISDNFYLTATSHPHLWLYLTPLNTFYLRCKDVVTNQNTLQSRRNILPQQGAMKTFAKSFVWNVLLYGIENRYQHRLEATRIQHRV